MQLQVSYKQIWKLAYPLMLGAVALNITNVINTAFMGRVSEAALGAAAVGGVFYFSLVMIGMGLGIGAQIMIARKGGENKYLEIGEIVDHTVLLLLGLGLLFTAIIAFCSTYIFQHLLQDRDITNECIQYLHFRNWGMLISLGNILFRGLFTGIARTKTIMVGIGILSVVNVLLDYTFIFGHFGFPQMGIAGAGLASTIAEGCSLLYYILFTQYRLDKAKYNLFRFKNYQPKLLLAITKLSLPMVFQNMISLGAWFLFFVIIEQTGKHPLAISNIVRSVYMLLMTPIWGYASATTTMVSNIIGQGKGTEIASLLKKLVIISVSSSAVISLSNIFIPRLLLSVFTNDEAIIQDAVNTIYLLAVCMQCFSIAVILLSALSGTGDTKVSLYIEASTISIYMLYLYYVTLVKHYPLEIIWAAELVYWILIGGLSYWRLKQKKWVVA